MKVFDRVSGYLDLWFDKEITVAEVDARARDRVICLNNSWTPKWYAALDRDTILGDEHLLSRVIRHALEVHGGPFAAD